MKPCRICGEYKELDEFSKTKHIEFYPDGHVNWCRDCLKLYKRMKRREKKEQEGLSEQMKISRGFVEVQFT